MFGGGDGGGDGGGGSSPAVLQQTSALEMKAGALVVLLCVTLLFGLAPLGLAGRFRLGPGERARMPSLISCFAGGVFSATCLLGLLPDYLRSMEGACSSAGITLRFPLAEFIVAVGLFLVLILEQMVLSFTERRSCRSEQRQALLVDSGVQNDDGSSRRRGSGHLLAGFGSPSALRAFVLVFSLSLHSAFEGLAVALLEDGREVLEVCLALVIHKSVIAFSLAFRLWQGRLRRSVVAGCLLMFAAMSPLGVGVGLGLAETEASPQHQLARATLQGLATGTFAYVTFVDILPQELHSAADRILKVAAVLLGFAVVTAVLFIKL